MIYGGIVVLWLCYLVPLALRRYDDASRARSVERFSTAMRVLGSGGSDGAPRQRPSGGLAADGPVVTSSIPRSAHPAGRQSAARAAASRRRRVLGVLLLLGCLTAVPCVLGLAPWWVLVLPLGLIVAFLVTARIQVARGRDRRWERTLLSGAEAETSVRSERPVERSMESVPPAGAEPDEAPTVVFDVLPEQPAVVAVTVPTVDGGSLWDPLPVTLPTYVTKPRATRTVRTIDLGGDGAWTSGRLSADEVERTEEAAREAAATTTGGAGSAPEPQHARAAGD